jgi:hypothetical protein
MWKAGGDGASQGFNSIRPGQPRRTPLVPDRGDPRHKPNKKWKSWRDSRIACAAPQHGRGRSSRNATETVFEIFETRKCQYRLSYLTKWAFQGGTCWRARPGWAGLGRAGLGPGITNLTSLSLQRFGALHCGVIVQREARLRRCGCTYTKPIIRMVSRKRPEKKEEEKKKRAKEGDKARNRGRDYLNVFAEPPVAGTRWITS